MGGGVEGGRKEEEKEMRKINENTIHRRAAMLPGAVHVHLRAETRGGEQRDGILWSY